MMAVGWRVVQEHHLGKEFRFRDFAAALEFANHIGALAEAAAHHPDLEIGWGRVLVKLWTHTANGVTEKDYCLAAQIDQLC